MALSAFKSRVQEHLYNAFAIWGRSVPAQRQHIGVIVAAGHFCRQRIGAVGAAGALDLVGGDGNTMPVVLDYDSLVALAGDNGFCNRLYRIPGNHALRGEAAEYPQSRCRFLPSRSEFLLEQIPAVIAANGNFHNRSLPCSKFFKFRLSRRKCTKILVSALPQQTLALPDGAAHMPGGVRNPSPA